MSDEPIEIEEGQVWRLNTIDGTATIRISAVHPWPRRGRRPTNWRGRRLTIEHLDGAAVGADWREFDLTDSPNAELIEIGSPPAEAGTRHQEQQS